MGLISAPVALFDVGNCEAFVQRTIDRSTIHYATAEREELLAEGWALLFELAEKYKPLPEPPCGYHAWFAMTLADRQAYEAQLRAGATTKRGRFSGHAAMFLPRRLGDAWHKFHPEHLYVTNPETGKRGWHYGRPMLSLDAFSTQQYGHDSYAAERHLLNARALGAFCHTASISFHATAGAL